MNLHLSTVNYDYLLESKTQRHWRQLGLKKRSGVATPLFSLYSQKSIGIGEFPDLKLFIDWCESVKIGIVQLLPMNDVGYDFRPYDAQSSFALEPMYLSLENLKSVDLEPFKDDIENLRRRFPVGVKKRVDYQIKGAKLEILFRIFDANQSHGPNFDKFVLENRFWLEDYVHYRTLKERYQESGWESWDSQWREKQPGALQQLKEQNQLTIQFWNWIQWQCYEQFKEVKAYGREKSILVMGDLPFLVSRDSADVWSRQDYFKLSRVAGAPPDRYFAQGQRWGMPPYHWENIAKHDYDYLVQKLKYAENFYDLFRLDHVVGAFRLWTLSVNEEEQDGSFDPAEESLWEEHGSHLLGKMIESSGMLPCGEDLGTIPQCAFTTLDRFGIPGMDVQRWMKDWEQTKAFKSPDEYRRSAIAMLSTHDMPAFMAWWKYEIATLDEGYAQSLFDQFQLDFESLKHKIFDLANSAHGRLRWNTNIRSKAGLVELLGRPEKDLGEIVSQFEATYDEREKFFEYLNLPASVKSDNDLEILRGALKCIHQSLSIFSIQMLQDWLSLGPDWKEDPWNFRINVPGTNSPNNWSIVMPDSIESMMGLTVNQEIKEINETSGRF